MSGADRYTVHHSEPFEEDEGGVVAGVLTIDAGQRIAIVSAEPPFADQLELAAEMINETDEFMLRAMPPPDAPPRSNYRRLVARDAPDAREAVLEILRAEYGFELTAGPAAAA